MDIQNSNQIIIIVYGKYHFNLLMVLEDVHGVVRVMVFAVVASADI